MDAAEPHPFSADPYFVRATRSRVLCLPILRQSTLIGVLYLENNLATHAFTPGRVKVLELLASQAAISLENAQLYTDLQQENRERKRVEATCANGKRASAAWWSPISSAFSSGTCRAASATRTTRFCTSSAIAATTCCPERALDCTLLPPEYRARDEGKGEELRRNRQMHAVREGIHPQGRRPGPGADRCRPV